VFLKLRPLLYSLVYLIGLEAIVIFHRHVLILVIFLTAISIYQGWRIGGKWKFSTPPAFFTLSSVALLYLITIHYEQQTFIILSALMYYLSLLGAYRLSKYEGDQTARGMNMAATVSTIFFTYAGAYGLYLNFLVPLWSLMLAYLFVTLLVSYQYFSIIKEEKKTVWIYSFILALAMAEIVWTINFWPFGYLTAGAIALILYYVLWDLIQSHFLNLLSKKRVVANLIFFSAVIFMILITSKWIPVI
jgi:hypothetical protein